jgi:hypothetical protein
VQELPLAVEQRPHDGDSGGHEHAGEQEARDRFRRREVDQADLPGLHGERLAAAQPAPQEVGGEGEEDEDLQLQARYAWMRGVGAAAREVEDPGGEEGDCEEQQRLVRHAGQAPREARG